MKSINDIISEASESHDFPKYWKKIKGSEVTIKEISESPYNRATTIIPGTNAANDEYSCHKIDNDKWLVLSGSTRTDKKNLTDEEFFDFIKNTDLVLWIPMY